MFKAQYFQLTLSGIRKDGKQLLPDYDKFIPFDVPNHDDWNDLFNDPVKLEDKLIRSDGRKRSMSDLAVRFRLMHKVESPETFAVEDASRVTFHAGSFCVNASLLVPPHNHVRFVHVLGCS